MDLGGLWQVAIADEELRRTFADRSTDDATWEQLDVPGHWRSSTAFADTDGPLFYRRSFSNPVADGGRGGRDWLVLDGIFYQGDVWLDGAYLGDTEGYFIRHTFEKFRELLYAC